MTKSAAFRRGLQDLHPYQSLSQPIDYDPGLSYALQRFRLSFWPEVSKADSTRLLTNRKKPEKKGRYAMRRDKAQLYVQQGSTRRSSAGCHGDVVILKVQHKEDVGHGATQTPAHSKLTSPSASSPTEPACGAQGNWHGTGG